MSRSGTGRTRKRQLLGGGSERGCRGSGCSHRLEEPAEPNLRLEEAGPPHFKTPKRELWTFGPGALSVPRGLVSL